MSKKPNRPLSAKLREQVVVKKSDVHFVAFDTKKRPGYVVGVRIIISEDIVLDDETVSIALADHPLYKQLQQYVLSNPR